MSSLGDRFVEPGALRVLDLTLNVRVVLYSRGLKVGGVRRLPQFLRADDRMVSYLEIIHHRFYPNPFKIIILSLSEVDTMSLNRL